MKSQHKKLQAQVDALTSTQQGSTSMEEDVLVINSRPSKSSYNVDSHLDQLDKIVEPTKCTPTQADIPVVKSRPTKIDSALASYLERLDKIKEPTKCALISPHVSEQISCAVGRVFPIVSGLLLHGKPMTPGYVKVQVDNVCKGFGDLELPSPMEGIEKLIDARNTFIEWPKTRIRFLKTSTGTIATSLKSVNERTSTEPSKEPTKSAPQPYPVDA